MKMRKNLALLVIWDLLAWKISCSVELSMKKVLPAGTWSKVHFLNVSAKMLKDVSFIMILNDFVFVLMIDY